MKVSNLDQQEAWGAGSMLPVGRHVCTITTADEGQSSGGHPQIELEVTCDAGPHAGSTSRDWIVVVPATLGKVRQLLEAAGMEIQPGEWDLPVKDLKGRQVAVVVRMEEKRAGKNAGKEYPTIQSYSQPTSADAQALADVPGDTTGMATPTGAAQHDDDIPF